MSDLLINCAACGRMVSREAYSCPQCGHPIAASSRTHGHVQSVAPAGSEASKAGRGSPDRVRRGSSWSVEGLTTPSGRVGRAYFWAVLINGLLWNLVFGVIGMVAILASEATAAAWFVLAVFWVAMMFWIVVSAHVKRLHDLDRSGVWVLLGLVPLVNLGYLIWVGAAEGSPYNNRYGSPPKPLKVTGPLSVGVAAVACGFVVLIAGLALGAFPGAFDDDFGIGSSATDQTVRTTTTRPSAAATSTPMYEAIVVMPDRGRHPLSEAVAADPGYPAYEVCLDYGLLDALDADSPEMLCNGLSWAAAELKPPNYYQKITNVDPSRLDDIYCDGHSQGSSALQAGFEAWGDPWPNLMNDRYFSSGNCEPSLLGAEDSGRIDLPERYGWAEVPEDEVVTIWCVGAAQGMADAVNEQTMADLGWIWVQAVASDCAARA